MKKTVLKVCAALLVVVMLVGVGGSIGVSYAVYNKVNKGIETMNAQIETEKKYREKEEEKENEEKNKNKGEFVTIDNQYEIIDTSAISDAYKSGDTSKLTDDEKKTYDLAKKTLEKIIKGKNTVYEKELAVYDWIGDNVSFDSSSLLAIPGSGVNTYTPYGVLKGKSAVCVGFATTFKLFMNMMDLECKVVHDEELSHSWDIVKLDDNQWYFCDIALDDRSGGKVTHKYFNNSSAQFKQNHTFDASQCPVAEGVKYNYAVMNAKDIKDVKKIPKMVKDLIDNKKNSGYYRLPKDTDLDYIKAMCQGMSERINAMDSCSMEEPTITFDENGRYILVVRVSYYDDDNSNIDLSQFEGLEEILNSVFGSVIDDSHPTDDIKG